VIRKIIHIGVPIAIGLVGILSMSLIAYFLQNGTLPLWVISKHKVINFTFTMQMMALAVSFAVVAMMYLYDKERFKTFFRWSAKPFGKRSNWDVYGPAIALAFTVGTALLVSADVVKENGTINSSFFTLLPLVVFFSATNAWSEEIFSRFTIVAGLHGKLKPGIICLVSAIVFGVPHYFFGTPNGVFGVIMSGFLGWVLARSVVETKGLGWALLIHFLQDMVIFGGGAMIIAGHNE
jgi:uncharacterized protein